VLRKLIEVLKMHENCCYIYIDLTIDLVLFSIYYSLKKKSILSFCEGCKDLTNNVGVSQSKIVYCNKATKCAIDLVV
jgi:hypothetical protein